MINIVMLTLMTVAKGGHGDVGDDCCHHDDDGELDACGDCVKCGYHVDDRGTDDGGDAGREDCANCCVANMVLDFVITVIVMILVMTVGCVGDC
jgi:hypothetical protein